MQSLNMTKSDARRFFIHSQGFNHQFKDSYQVIEHLGYVQIDTISVVERAHHHVIWSRSPEYRPEHLQALVAKRQVFEYWAHAAAFLPMKDYRFTLCHKRKVKKKYKDLPADDKAAMSHVLSSIKRQGPMRSKDFDMGPKRSSKQSRWWDWKPAKRALERLFFSGRSRSDKTRGLSESL